MTELSARPLNKLEQDLAVLLKHQDNMTLYIAYAKDWWSLSLPDSTHSFLATFRILSNIFERNFKQFFTKLALFFGNS